MELLATLGEPTINMRALVEISLLMILSWSQPGTGHGPDALDQRARDVLSAGTPRAGRVEAVYEPESGTGRVAVGFDTATGAWYRATSTLVIGRDATGAGYAGEPRIGGTQPSNLDAPGADEIVSDFFPWLVLEDVLRRPAVVDHVAPRADGGLSLTLKFPGGMRQARTGRDVQGMDTQPRPWRVEVSAAGEVELIRKEVRGGVTEIRYEYRRESPEAIPMPKSMPGGWTLRSVRAASDSEATSFSTARVEELGASVRLYCLSAPGTTPARSGSATVDSPAASGASSGSPVTTSPAPSATPPYRPFAEYRLAVCLTGIVLVGIGAWVWIRHRR